MSETSYGEKLKEHYKGVKEGEIDPITEPICDSKINPNRDLTPYEVHQEGEYLPQKIKNKFRKEDLDELVRLISAWEGESYDSLKEASENNNEALRKFTELTREILQSEFGDSIPLYRGINEKKNGGKKYENSKSFESWTLDPGIAKEFAQRPGPSTFGGEVEGPTVLRKDVDVNKILTNPYLWKASCSEMEFIVESEGSNNPSDRIPLKEFDYKENAEWALKVLGYEG